MGNEVENVKRKTWRFRFTERSRHIRFIEESINTVGMEFKNGNIRKREKKGFKCPLPVP
jgi:hypothetical protein